MTKISVIGAGAWGTALAEMYSQSGHDVSLWVRETSLADTLRTTRENTLYLPNIALNPALKITEDLQEAAQADVLLCVVPAQFLRSVVKELSPHLHPNHPLVICAKGIETSTKRLLTHVVHEEAPSALPAILSGPNFAHEIAKGLPSASTLACLDLVNGKNIQLALKSRNLRLYFTEDVVGAQVGGAVKNVIAIACGIVDGLGLGESARAALITRGLAEISRLTLEMGGRKETLMGQCGVGDMMLTCSSMKSRNFSLGSELAKGSSLNDILSRRRAVTEGVPTAKAAHELALQHGVEMPIVSSVYACLYQNLDIKQAVGHILDRPARSEGD